MTRSNLAALAIGDIVFVDYPSGVSFRGEVVDTNRRRLRVVWLEGSGVWQWSRWFSTDTGREVREHGDSEHGRRSDRSIRCTT